MAKVISNFFLHHAIGSFNDPKMSNLSPNPICETLRLSECVTVYWWNVHDLYPSLSIQKPLKRSGSFSNRKVEQTTSLLDLCLNQLSHFYTLKTFGVGQNCNFWINKEREKLYFCRDILLIKNVFFFLMTSPPLNGTAFSLRLLCSSRVWAGVPVLWGGGGGVIKGGLSNLRLYMQYIKGGQDE